MPQASPRYSKDRSATRAKSFTDAQVNAVTSLQTVSGFPPFGPDVVELHATSAASVVTLTLEDNSDFIVELAAGETRLAPVPVKAFKSRTGVVTANCYWWSVPSRDDPQYQIAPNP